MKKIVCILIALMLVFASLPAFADGEYADASTGGYYGETEFDYHVYSYYYVTIPTHVDAGGTGTLSVSMDYIEDGYHIEAYVTNLDNDGCLTIYSDNYDTNNITGKLGVVKYLSDDMTTASVGETGLIGEFYPNDYAQNTSASVRIGFRNCAGENLLPGGYHGVICFRVECMPD